MFFDFVSTLIFGPAQRSRSLETRILISARLHVHRYIDVVVVLTLSYYSLLSSTFASTLAEHCSRMTSSTATYGTWIHV